jgi:hypothetical protein
MKEMNYRICSRLTRDPIDPLPMHVLANAYRRAWRVRHGSDPQGKHVIEGLDLLIEFFERKAEEKIGITPRTREEAFAKAQAEMMARVHAEQRAIAERRALKSDGCACQ